MGHHVPIFKGLKANTMGIINSVELAAITKQRHSSLVSLVERRIGEQPVVIVPAATKSFESIDIPWETAQLIVMGCMKLTLDQKLQFLNSMRDKHAKS